MRHTTRPMWVGTILRNYGAGVGPSLVACSYIAPCLATSALQNCVGALHIKLYYCIGLWAKHIPVARHDQTKPAPHGRTIATSFSSSMQHRIEQQIACCSRAYCPCAHGLGCDTPSLGSARLGVLGTPDDKARLTVAMRQRTKTPLRALRRLSAHVVTFVGMCSACRRHYVNLARCGDEPTSSADAACPRGRLCMLIEARSAIR